MNVRLQIKLPYFRACGLTSPYRESVVSFLLISFSSQYIPTAVHSTVILGGGFPAPQCRTGIWYLWIFILFSSTVISYCLCTPYYFVYLLFILVMKLVLPLFFWVLPWLFLGPSSPDWTALPGFHLLRSFLCSLFMPWFFKGLPWKYGVVCHPLSKW